MNSKLWIRRWERMQERYVDRREQRFRLIAGIIRDTQRPAPRILDLGCGPVSLIEALLIEFPTAQIWGLDHDPALLMLGRERFAGLDRVCLIEADLRAGDWLGSIGRFDAIVSATALHWLTATRLADLYAKLADLLESGGVLLNADHVGSCDTRLQRAWDQRRDERIAQNAEADDWDGFWEAY